MMKDAIQIYVSSSKHVQLNVQLFHIETIKHRSNEFLSRESISKQSKQSKHIHVGYIAHF